MIRELEYDNWHTLLPFIHRDNARNYFIRLGLEGNRPVYGRIFVETDSTGLIAALFERQSGNLQFYATDPAGFDVQGFSKCLLELSFKEFICPASLGDVFFKAGCFSSFKEGAIIAGLMAHKPVPFDAPESIESHPLLGSAYTVGPVTVADLPDIVGLYLKVFHSFSPLVWMEKKLLSQRGRGILVRKAGQLVAVAQSEFEAPDSAIIVGVATDPEYQGLGLATQCMSMLCTELRLEKKNLFLQYDNPSAGRIYEKLGFEPVDRMRHYLK